MLMSKGGLDLGKQRVHPRTLLMGRTLLMRRECLQAKEGWLKRRRAGCDQEIGRELVGAKGVLEWERSKIGRE